jgi:two-component system osmolarity sensor histidine kinase EnvZ
VAKDPFSRRRTLPQLRLRDVLPRDIFRRSLLMIALPIFILFGIATWFFFDRHWDTVQRRLTDSVAADIAFAVRRNESGNMDQALMSEWERATQVRCTLSATRREFDEAFPWVEPSFRALEMSLEGHLPGIGRQGVGQFDEDAHVILLSTAGPIACRVPIDRITTSTPYIFFVWIFGTALLVLGLATYFLWKQVEPIRQLAISMEAFGKGEDLGPIRERGPDEIRRAARAFERMKARIKRQVQRRTDMLAAISHDLRTPLSRMRIEVEMLDSSHDQDGLRQDISEMEAMIQGYLEFARDQVAEPSVEIDLVDLLESLAETFRYEEVDVVTDTRPLNIRGRMDGLRRAFSNVIANGLRYGDHCQISISTTSAMITIAVDDNGPGIPEDRRADVFRPFIRLDASRNKATGGAGLGLTIARDVALSHGGTLDIADAPDGGARLVFSFPR